MALVPIIQPIAIKACTTKKERAIRIDVYKRQVLTTLHELPAALDRLKTPNV